MDALRSSPADVDAKILHNMLILYRYPGASPAGMETALELYRKELSIFAHTDLALGWKRIVQSHKSTWWPTIATLLSACRAEMLFRRLTEMAKPLPGSLRRSWTATRKRLFLAAAASGFSQNAVDRALLESGQWFADRNIKQ